MAPLLSQRTEFPGLSGGFGQKLIHVSTPLAPGTYSAQVALKSASGATLSSQTTAAFVVPSTTWLGNSLGISSAIQPPWTPIQVNGTSFSVWGRTYDLSGGFGMPQQIMSKGENLLAVPIDIESPVKKPI